MIGIDINSSEIQLNLRRALESYVWSEDHRAERIQGPILHLIALHAEIF